MNPPQYESEVTTKQDANLDAPDVMLAQFNSTNMMSHKLVQENQQLKTTTTELQQEVKSLTGDRAGMKRKIEHLEASGKTGQRLIVENRELKKELAKVREEVNAKEAEAKLMEKKLDAICEIASTEHQRDHREPDAGESSGAEGGGGRDQQNRE